MLFGDLDLMVVIHFDLYKNKRRVQIARITNFAPLPVQNQKKISELNAGLTIWIHSAGCYLGNQADAVSEL